MTTVTEVQQHNAQSRERVLSKPYGILDAENIPDVQYTAQIVQAAMMELAAIWREEAAAFVEAKRRGWKSTSDGRTQAAALLAGFAVGLTTVRTGTIVIPLPPMDNKGGGCGDPHCDFQVQCGKCFGASERQYNEWFARAGHNRSTHRLVIDEMREQAHADALVEYLVRDDPKPSTELLGGGMTAENPEQLMAFMRGETDDPGVVHAVRGGIQFPQPPDPHICLHPDSARSTLKSGVIMCTLCNQAVGQAVHLPALVPGSKPGPVITGDPTMDYLTGATDRYEPRPRAAGPGETVPAEMTGDGPMFPGQVGYREAEHGRPQAPCFECVSIDEDPAPWCDCTPQDGQPCKGPCRLLAHAYTFHPQGCTHVTKHNSLPVVCIYCGADVTEVFHPTAPKESPMQPAVDNPFTSPAAPTRNRPAVKRLTYADLGLLTAATYPYPRAHLSHSYVESIEKCGLSALLSDASRAGHIAPRRPSWSLIGGNAFHVAVEGIERASIAIGGAAPTAELGDWEVYWNTALNSQIDEVRESLAGTPYADPSTWHIANKGLEGYDWWRVQGLDMVQRYLAHHDTAWRSTHTLLQVPADPAGTPEHASRVPVLELPFTVSAGSTAITMEGRIDAAWLATGPEYATATLEVIDHKAGKSLPVDHFQLVEYGDVLRKHLPVNFALSVVGRYWRARLGTYTPPVPLPAAAGQAEIDYRYQAADRAMRHAVFAPRVDNMCSSCGAVDLCPAQSMRDAT